MPLNGFQQTIPVGRSLPPAPFPRTSVPTTFNDRPQEITQAQQYPQSVRTAATRLRSQTPPQPVLQQHQDMPLTDQFDGPLTAIMNHDRPQRGGSEPRNPITKGNANGRTAVSGGFVSLQVTAENMKLPVKNTLPTNLGPNTLKHETSQTTEDSAPESDWGRSIEDEGQALQFQHHRVSSASHRRRNSVASSSSNDSTTFNPEGYKDIEDVQSAYVQPERTAILHPVRRSNPLNTHPDHLDHKSKASVLLRHTPATVKGLPRQASDSHTRPVNDDRNSEILRPGQAPGNDSTSTLFGPLDKEDMHEWRRGRHHDETPSKLAPHQTSKTVINPLPKQGSTTRQAHPQPDRSSSPLEEDFKEYQPSSDPNLAVYQSYGKEKVDEFLQSREVENRNVLATSTNVSAKVPESSEVSEDECPPVFTEHNSRNNKRVLDQIDYEQEQLRVMSYAELDKITFLEDPRVPVLQPAFNETGVSITLDEKLSSLSQMNAEDQKSLFRSLTDAENEQAGQWFVESFRGDLKRMMEKRLERRKVALRFELEAKKRHKAVETKQADIETELKELRQGGGNLLLGRASPRPSGGKGK